jgi:hypothetical protein
LAKDPDAYAAEAAGLLIAAKLRSVGLEPATFGVFVDTPVQTPDAGPAEQHEQ